MSLLSFANFGDLSKDLSIEIDGDLKRVEFTGILLGFDECEYFDNVISTDESLTCDILLPS